VVRAILASVGRLVCILHVCYQINVVQHLWQYTLSLIFAEKSSSAVVLSTMPCKPSVIHSTMTVPNPEGAASRLLVEAVCNVEVNEL
jgi:hypothetical protein